MHADSARFPENVADARRDATLLGALGRLQRDARAGRVETVARLPEFEALRDAARDIRNGALANLAANLERFEENVVANGGAVHWCRDAAEACEAVARICREAEAKTVAKGKSMVSEEIDLNTALLGAGFDVVETDLGEYVLQLRDETPSHIVIPAIHLTKDQFAKPSAARTTRSRRTGRSRRPARSPTRPGASFATSSCVPMSGSPAPTSSSPRPDRS